MSDNKGFRNFVVVSLVIVLGLSEWSFAKSETTTEHIHGSARSQVTPQG